MDQHCWKMTIPPAMVNLWKSLEPVDPVWLPKVVLFFSGMMARR